MPGSGRSPGGGNGYTLFSPRQFHGQRSLASYSPWGNLKLTKKQEILSVRVLGCQQYLANLKRKKGFSESSVGKESDCNAGDSGTIPGSGRSPGEGIGYPLQYSWASLVAQLGKDLPAMQETWVRSSWVRKIPWRRERLPTPVFWPGEFHGLQSPWGGKESDTTK